MILCSSVVVNVFLLKISVFFYLSKFLWLLVIMCLVYQNTLEAAENLIKAHEAFITTTDANDEKINAVLQFANRLIEDQHYAADKVHKKAENISERYVESPCWLVLCLSLFDVEKLSEILICYITVLQTWCEPTESVWTTWASKGPTALAAILAGMWWGIIHVNIISQAYLKQKILRKSSVNSFWIWAINIFF